jgi:hypothetical protein
VALSLLECGFRVRDKGMQMQRFSGHREKWFERECTRGEKIDSGLDYGPGHEGNMVVYQQLSDTR